MKTSLRKLAPNFYEVSLGSEKRLYFSYETLVAVWEAPSSWYRTREFYSKTTTKHLNKFIPDNAYLVESSTLESIARG